MSVPLMLLLLAPLAGAVLAMTFAEFPLQRRVLVGVCSAAMAGGAVAALVRSAGRQPVAWRGFAADALIALLVAGSVVVSVGAIARAGAREKPATAEAALFVTSAAGVVPLLVGGIHLVVVTLPLVTIGFAVCSLAVGEGGGADLRARRALAALAASDVAAIVALGTAVSSTTRLPPSLTTTAAAIALGSAIVRLGLVPAVWSGEDARRADPVLGAVWMGPVRAQGILLLLFAAGSHRGVAYAGAAAAAVTGLVAAERGGREGRLGTLSMVGVSLAVVGLSLAGPLAVWGAVLCLAATFVHVPAWSAGGGWREAARPTPGALPAAALLPGAALVAAGALQAAAVRPALLAFALPALGMTVAVASAALSDRREGGSVGRPVADIWAALATCATIAIAALPLRVVHGLALPVADAMGVGRLLSVRGDPDIAEGLSFVMAATALAAFAVGPGRAGTGGAPGVARRTRRRIDTYLVWWAASAAAPSGLSVEEARRADQRTRRWTTAAAVLVAATIGVALRVYVVASRRGFL